MCKFMKDMLCVAILVSCKMATKSGRPRKSNVWDYYTYDTELDKSECQILIGEKICGAKLNGKFPSNLRSHIRNNHNETFKILEEKDKEKAKNVRKKTDTKTQLTLSACTGSLKRYEKQDVRYKKITRKLAVFAASSSVPNSIVESSEFRSLMEELEPRYPVPCRSALGKEIDKIVMDIKLNIISKFEKARKIHLCVDIWSKKGLTASFIGITAHFFADHERHHITLAVRRMPSPHTGDAILEVVSNVLAEWDIMSNKVGKIITDNGSNMIKAFKNVQATLIQESGESDDEFMDSDSVDGNRSCNNVEDESDEDLILTEETSIAAVQSELCDFEDQEMEHEVSFSQYDRLSCFAHTLQLVVSHFDKSKTMYSAIKRAKKLVSKVNMSTKATEKLISLAGKKLMGDCPTRWSSTFLLVERLLEVRTELSQVLNELEWNNLQISDWKQLEYISLLLEPFAQYTNLSGGEDYTTVSSVVPIIMELKLHLSEMKKKPNLSTVSLCLYEELERRFGNLISPEHINFNPLYLAATSLDPQFTKFNMITSKEQKDAAKQYILQLRG